MKICSEMSHSLASNQHFDRYPTKSNPKIHLHLLSYSTYISLLSSPPTQILCSTNIHPFIPIWLWYYFQTFSKERPSNIYSLNLWGTACRFSCSLFFICSEGLQPRATKKIYIYWKKEAYVLRCQPLKDPQPQPQPQPLDEKCFNYWNTNS